MADLSNLSDQELARAAGISLPVNLVMPNGEQERNAIIQDVFEPGSAPNPQPDLSGLSNEELLKAAGINQDSSVNTQDTKPGYAEDIAKSAIYRGIPEAVAGSTLGGLGLNVIRGVSDLTRWAAGKGYKAIYGEELPRYTANPIPTSSDALRFLSKEVLDKDLYDPQTVPGEYANTIAQFATSGKIFGAPLRATIPSAVVSETAGQATKGSEWETPARLAGALLAPGGVASSRGRAPLKSAEEIRSASSDLYKLAEQKGGILKEDVANKFINDLNAAKPAKIAGKVLTSEDKNLIKALDEFKGLKNTKLNLTDFQRLDEALGNKAESFVDPRTGRYTKQGMKISSIQQKLRDTVENVSEESVVGGKEGFEALKKARGEWAKQARLSDIERIVQRAENMQQPSSAIKSGFNTLLNNPNRIRGFTEEERKLIKQAAKTGVVSDILRTGGSRLIPIIAGSAGGGLLGSMVGYAESAAARGLANKIQFDKANRVAESVARRGEEAPKSPLLQLLEGDAPAFKGVDFKSDAPASAPHQPLKLTITPKDKK